MSAKCDVYTVFRFTVKSKVQLYLKSISIYKCRKVKGHCVEDWDLNYVELSGVNQNACPTPKMSSTMSTYEYGNTLNYDGRIRISNWLVSWFRTVYGTYQMIQLLYEMGFKRNNIQSIVHTILVLPYQLPHVSLCLNGATLCVQTKI
jgi:hypothetical protein